MYKQIIAFVLIASSFSCKQNNNATDNKKIEIVDSPAVGPGASVHSDDYEENMHTGIKRYSSHEDIPNLPATLAPFVPAGYTAIDTTSGDLNQDEYPDRIMVLKQNGEDTTSNVVDHPTKRPLLILIGQADSTYKLAGRCDNAVYCIDCGGAMGDPFQNIVIKKGYFSIEHYGGSAQRWTRTITFKYSPTDNYWFLHKDGSDYFDSQTPDDTHSRIKTTKDFGKVPFDKYDIYKEEKE